jgi:anhydro-N-acetylmuramic acid kinase
MQSIKLSKKNELNIVGIMNGTSLDGIDYVLISVKRSGKKVFAKYLKHESRDFPKQLHEKLKKATIQQLDVKSLALVHHELGRLYAEQLKEIQKKKRWKFDLIGLHGQTVYHAGGVASFQIGEASYMSYDLNVPVVSDFRVADIAAGGQGAPIASLFHRDIFSKEFKGKSIALHNIGGISNLTLLNNKGDVEQAFDTGPGNMLIDLLVQEISNGSLKFDKDGGYARAGTVDQSLVEKMLQHEFFSKRPPKSCGREEFGSSYLQKYSSFLEKLKNADRVATVSEFTLQTMANAYIKLVRKSPTAIVLCGGGAKNSFIKERLSQLLPKAKVHTTEDFGWPLESIEGAAFALLAAYRIWGIPNNLPKTTGAKKPVLMGKISE